MDTEDKSGDESYLGPCAVSGLRQNIFRQNNANAIADLNWLFIGSTSASQWIYSI